MSVHELKTLTQTMFTNIDKDLKDDDIFKKIKQKTGIEPSKVCLGIVAVICLLAILDIAADLLTTLFGMVYPAYMSFKAIQRKDQQQKKIWLTYWIVFGMLTTVDDIFSSILNLIPGFYALRFIVYVWMFYPRANNGSVVIYKYLKPYLQKWKLKLQQVTVGKQVKKGSECETTTSGKSEKCQ